MANLAEVLAAAQTMLRDEGLSTWTIRWSHSARTAGQCCYNAQTVKLSRTLMEVWTLEQCRQTIAHETAHALTRGHGHDAVWRRECIRLGGTGERCWGGDDRARPEMKIKGVCPQGHEFGKTRMPSSRRYCRRCGRGCTSYNLITWAVNPNYGKPAAATPRPTLRRTDVPTAAQAQVPPTPAPSKGKAPRCHAPMPGGRICNRVQGHTRGHDAR